jgi:hypothetical protein
MSTLKLELKKAVREQLKLRVALIGPSGSGKTYTALRLAKGMEAKTGKPTLLIDTENGRGKIYANEFDYCYEAFQEPFSPERYIEYMKAAEEVGVGQLILDGVSPEWKYLLAQLGMLKHTNTNKNEFASWDKITPRHDAFISSIIYSNIHLILLMRGKDEYKLEEKNGKNVPRKVGVGPIMRDGLEYECNVAFTIDLDGHIALQMKDDTHYFQDVMRPLTEKDGEFLINWAGGGIEVVPRVAPVSVALPTATLPKPQANKPKKTFKEIDLSIHMAQSLEELKTVWENIQSTIKQLTDKEVENLLISKNLTKERLSDLENVIGAPRVDIHKQAAEIMYGKGAIAEAHKVLNDFLDSPPPEKEVIFDKQGNNGIGKVETTHLLTLVSTVKIRSAMDGALSLAKEYLQSGTITQNQYNSVLGKAAEQEEKLLAAKNAKKAPVSSGVTA